MSVNDRMRSGYRYQYVVHENWHAGGAREPEILIGKYYAGSPAWEFVITDRTEALRSAMPRSAGLGRALQVAVFEDAWRAFAELPELFAALAEASEDPRISLDAVRRILDHLGFEDA